MFQIGTDNKKKKYGSLEDIFILSEACHWCATCFDKSRLPPEKCLICLNEEMSSLPILPNEAFTFNYNDKREVELSSIGYHQSKDSIMNITRYINNKNS
jgi:hypothetical protein